MLLRKKILSKRNSFDLKRLDRNTIYKNFFLFMIGLAISSIAFSVIYVPYDILVSGSSGLAVFINYYLNIDLSLIIFVISAVLLVISFIVFGIDYGAKNILITILSPTFIKAATLLNNIISFEKSSLFLLSIFAGILSGIAFGFIKKSGYNTGGFGVLYDIISSKFKISVSNANLICNVVIMLMGLYIFGISSCIYGIIALYVSSVVSNKIMLGISNNKAFYIVTSKPNDVKECIINNLKHGVTVINAKGGYSGKKKKMLLCVIPTTHYIRLKEIIKEIDNNAFFLITDCYHVSKKLNLCKD